MLNSEALNQDIEDWLKHPINSQAQSLVLRMQQRIKYLEEQLEEVKWDFLEREELHD